jgi:hypothetical protein
LLLKVNIKPEGKRIFEGPSCCWMTWTEGFLGWILMDQDGDKFRADVNVVLYVMFQFMERKN